MDPDFNERPIHAKSIDETEIQRPKTISDAKTVIRDRVILACTDKLDEDLNGLDSVEEHLFNVEYNRKDDPDFKGDSETEDDKDQYILYNIEAEVERIYMQDVCGEKPIISNFTKAPTDIGANESAEPETPTEAKPTPEEQFAIAMKEYNERVAEYKRTRRNFMLRQYLT